MRSSAFRCVSDRYEEEKAEFAGPAQGEEARLPSLADVHCTVLFGLHRAILEGDIEVSGVSKGQRAAGGGICSLPKERLAEYQKTNRSSIRIPAEFQALRLAREADFKRLAAEMARREDPGSSAQSRGP